MAGLTSIVFFLFLCALSYSIGLPFRGIVPAFRRYLKLAHTLERLPPVGAYAGVV